ncbi:MAG: hypothetical protein ACRDB0_07065 [Paraclostridium sp.]
MELILKFLMIYTLVGFSIFLFASYKNKGKTLNITDKWATYAATVMMSSFTVTYAAAITYTPNIANLSMLIVIVYIALCIVSAIKSKAKVKKANKKFKNNMYKSLSDDYDKLRKEHVELELANTNLSKFINLSDAEFIEIEDRLCGGNSCNDCKYNKEQSDCTYLIARDLILNFDEVVQSVRYE